MYQRAYQEAGRIKGLGEVDDAADFRIWAPRRPQSFCPAVNALGGPTAAHCGHNTPGCSSGIRVTPRTNAWADVLISERPGPCASRPADGRDGCGPAATNRLLGNSTTAHGSPRAHLVAKAPRTWVPGARVSKVCPCRLRKARKPSNYKGFYLDVVVEDELPRVGTEAHRIDLLLALVGDPGLDQIVGEDPSRPQEIVVGFQRRQ